ncbi:phosphoribosylaminoimidazole-succinocarboxamide synthase [Actinocatenispora thailandica]|uniref:Phosphoribosylaminoimidazole-succinocarboxamide synthase n=1 Tax=Actinocatenispora thailandica TaxID=227318 RepID=A0A7R7DSI3_9ACTN|nr:phosphoribosylaminoimidazolesuccinocarboxamide synthase [Actinocatenispora thailandica]BCJ36931.1 phosphoribosylaminoimidazole-succinocarboxamide synthase [Actinocatenispora thailandica]
MKHVYSGKIRDLYEDDNGDIILVASDKISVYDVVLPTPIPDKGKLLTQLSLWWFDQLADLVPNHVISGTDVPAEWAGRAVRCRPLKMLPVECIARGYLAGLGLQEYEKQGAVSGVELPAGLVEGSKLPEPIFTPTTKATEGHDEFITLDDVTEEFGAELTGRIRDLTLEVYRRGAELARERGIIIADTKLEFGIDAEGQLVLADEVLTSDSSRFWAVEEWQPGRPQRAMDKQFIRDWAAAVPGWDKTYPGPEVPAEVVATTRARYQEAYERITGNTWTA